MKKISKIIIATLFIAILSVGLLVGCGDKEVNGYEVTQEEFNSAFSTIKESENITLKMSVDMKEDGSTGNMTIEFYKEGDKIKYYTKGSMAGVNMDSTVYYFIEDGKYYKYTDKKEEISKSQYNASNVGSVLGQAPIDAGYDALEYSNGKYVPTDANIEENMNEGYIMQKSQNYIKFNSDKKLIEIRGNMVNGEEYVKYSVDIFYSASVTIPN